MVLRASFPCAAGKWGRAPYPVLSRAPRRSGISSPRQWLRCLTAYALGQFLNESYMALAGEGTAVLAAL